MSDKNIEIIKLTQTTEKKSESYREIEEARTISRIKSGRYDTASRLRKYIELELLGLEDLIHTRISDQKISFMFERRVDRIRGILNKEIEDIGK